MGIFDINGGGGGEAPESQKVSVNLQEAQDLVCSACGNRFFKEVTFFKKVSALLSPTGQAGLIPIPAYACTKCENVNDEFLPKQLLNG
jgi:DNA-directed RNA polymerase subunit RPC12/RpoP